MDRRKICQSSHLTAFKLAKDTGFGLEQQRQRNLALTKYLSAKETTPEK
ncbi:hypothetical protein JL830_18815 [Vibrio parahaemolyticus]|nr:hypothetical protein [Vibrio parahaemolyticus]MDG2757301.1 hypothetical protein [Vibrio parahaemolyticus]HAV2004383.1 hypothetical protein [Vibrio parahaemolyticus]